MSLLSHSANAARYRIRHIVFTIDSDGVSGSGEVWQVYELLKRYASQMQYHVVVKTCKGDALAFVVMANTLNALPGAVLGGGEFQPPESKAMRSPEDIEIFHAGLAARVVAASQARGRRGDLVRCMVDVFDALTSKRPYKDPWPHEKAMEILAEGRGTHFSPDLLDVFAQVARPLYDRVGGREDVPRNDLADLMRMYFAQEMKI